MNASVLESFVTAMLPHSLPNVPGKLMLLPDNPYSKVRSTSHNQGGQPLTRRQLLTLEAQSLVANWDRGSFRVPLEPAVAGQDTEVYEAANILLGGVRQQ